MLYSVQKIMQFFGSLIVVIEPHTTIRRKNGYPYLEVFGRLNRMGYNRRSVGVNDAQFFHRPLRKRRGKEQHLPGTPLGSSGVGGRATFPH